MVLFFPWLGYFDGTGILTRFPSIRYLGRSKTGKLLSLGEMYQYVIRCH
jgi:hypothetical protein